jgi:hypothetical protein
VLALALAVGGTASVPRQAHAQRAVPILVGGMSGLAAGTYVSLGVVAVEARTGRYLNSPTDAFGFRSVPVLVGAATGVTLGAVDGDRLYDAMKVSVAAGAVGFGAGWLIGSSIWEDRGGKWAGAVIGSAAGIVLGGVVGAIVSDGEDDGSGGDGTGGGLPIAFTIRF